MEKQTKKTAPAAPKRDEEPVTNSRGLATQDKILEAAKTLLLKEGATKLTVSAVAKKAGVTPSAVRYHFGNTDMVLGGLLCEYYDYAGTQIAERITVAKICLHRARSKLKAIDEYFDWWRSSRRGRPPSTKRWEKCSTACRRRAKRFARWKLRGMKSGRPEWAGCPGRTSCVSCSRSGDTVLRSA